MSTGDFYELHFRVDPKFYGAPMPARAGGGGWSGKRLRLEKYGPLGRAWFGSPAPLKAAVGAGTVGALGLGYDYFGGGDSR